MQRRQMEDNERRLRRQQVGAPGQRAGAQRQRQRAGARLRRPCHVTSTTTTTAPRWSSHPRQPRPPPTLHGIAGGTVEVARRGASTLSGHGAFAKSGRGGPRRGDARGLAQHLPEERSMQHADAFHAAIAPATGLPLNEPDSSVKYSYLEVVEEGRARHRKPSEPTPRKPSGCAKPNTPHRGGASFWG